MRRKPQKRGQDAAGFATVSPLGCCQSPDLSAAAMRSRSISMNIAHCSESSLQRREVNRKGPQKPRLGQ